MLYGSKFPVIRSNAKDVMQKRIEYAKNFYYQEISAHKATSKISNCTTPDIFHKRVASNKIKDIPAKVVNITVNNNQIEEDPIMEEFIKKRKPFMFPEEEGALSATHYYDTKKPVKPSYRMKSPYKWIKEAEVTTKYINPFDFDEPFNQKLRKLKSMQSRHLHTGRTTSLECTRKL
jgi:hypothetical protein